MNILGLIHPPERKTGTIPEYRKAVPAPDGGVAFETVTETMQAVVKTATHHQQINGSLEDGIRNAFMLVPTQARRMELLNLLWKADENLAAVERLRP